MAMVMLTIMVCGMYYHVTSGVIIDALWTLGPVGLDARDVIIQPFQDLKLFFKATNKKMSKH